MSLDVYLTVPPCECCNADERTVYNANITHNLGDMARAANLYGPVWRPEENGITTAGQLVEPLLTGITELESNPAYYRSLEPENGWGKYTDLLKFLREYMNACASWPKAVVYASR